MKKKEFNLSEKKITKAQLEIYGSLERKYYAKLMHRRYNRGKQSYYD